MKRHHLSKSINKPSFKGISRAREIVTLVKHLCGKHENLSSIHRTHIKEEKKKSKTKNQNPARCGVVHSFQHWEDQHGGSLELAG